MIVSLKNEPTPYSEIHPQPSSQIDSYRICVTNATNPGTLSAGVMGKMPNTTRKSWRGQKNQTNRQPGEGLPLSLIYSVDYPEI